MALETAKSHLNVTGDGKEPSQWHCRRQRAIQCIYPRGLFHPIWKSAEVVPVPKTHPPTSIQDHLRPISLLPTLSKVFESIVGQWFLSVLEPSLDNCQFGCRKRRSTVHAITAILHTWMSSIDSGNSVRIVFVDFRKAFHLVNHNILFSKLIKHNIPHFLLCWFGSYLTGRQHRVRTSQSLSWKELKGAMPQGSWLGPLSFLVLINDLSTGCPVHKYYQNMPRLKCQPFYQIFFPGQTKMTWK